MEPDNTLYFPGQEEWRDWLKDNHDKVNEAWLIHYNKTSWKNSISHDEAIDEALCFGWIDGKIRSIDEEKYMFRYSPRKPNSIWSKINREKVEQLTRAGRMTAAGLARMEEAKKNGFWEKAYSNTNRVIEEMPPDLEAALREDEAAWTNFQGFANSYRNGYIGWVNDAKTEPTRMKRIGVVVERSAINKKPGIDL